MLTVHLAHKDRLPDAGAYEILASGACGTTLNWTSAACQSISGTQQLSTAMVRSGGNWVSDPNAWSVISRHGEYMQNETECNIPSALSVNTSCTGANDSKCLILDTQKPGTSPTCKDWAADGTAGPHTTATTPLPLYTTGDFQWNTFNFKYGTVIVRQKLPAKATRLWVGQWLLGSNCQTPNKYTGDTGQSYTGTCPAIDTPGSGYDEIDLLETKANDDAANGGNCWGNSWYVTNGTTSGNVTCWNSATRTSVADSANFHTYATTWCLNGQGACNFSGVRETVDSVDTGVVRASPPSNNMFLILQTQTSTDVTGSTATAGQVQIDYVKVCDSSLTAANCAAAATDGSNTGVIFYDDFAAAVVATAPTVTTTTATSITQTTASSGGTVTSNGGASVTSEGVCYSTSANPTTPCTSDGTATPFTSSLSGLASGTLYHYRAFATNSAGTGYGSDLTFSTVTPTYSISGTVSPAAGSIDPNPNVTVSCPTCTFTSVQTSAGGGYSFAGNPNGTYTVTPSKAGYTFSPVNRSVTVSGANSSGNNFTATGSAPVISLNPASLTFSSQGVGIPSTPQTITMTNTGNAQLTTIAHTITGTNAADYSKTSTCGTVLDAGLNCTISITFTPSAAGSRSATLTITSNIASVPAPLTGTGYLAPVPTCTPSGGTYKSGRMVSCTNQVPAATMCWQMGSAPTTNGNGTCTSGTTYAGPFMVTANGTLYVTGTQAGNTDNSKNYSFTINPTWNSGWVMNLPSSGRTTMGAGAIAVGSFSLQARTDNCVTGAESGCIWRTYHRTGWQRSPVEKSEH